MQIHPQATRNDLLCAFSRCVWHLIIFSLCSFIVVKSLIILPWLVKCRWLLSWLRSYHFQVSFGRVLHVNGTRSLPRLCRLCCLSICNGRAIWEILKLYGELKIAAFRFFSWLDSIRTFTYAPITQYLKSGIF